MTDRIYGSISLAMKAGKLASGEDNVLNDLKSGLSTLVILAEDASDNTKKRFTDKASYRGVPVRFYGTKEMLGRTIGKEERSSLSVRDAGFAKAIIEKIDEIRRQRPL